MNNLRTPQGLQSYSATAATPAALAHYAAQSPARCNKADAEGRARATPALPWGAPSIDLRKTATGYNWYRYTNPGTRTILRCDAPTIAAACDAARALGYTISVGRVYHYTIRGNRA